MLNEMFSPNYHLFKLPSWERKIIRSRKDIPEVSEIVPGHYIMDRNRSQIISVQRCQLMHKTLFEYCIFKGKNPSPNNNLDPILYQTRENIREMLLSEYEKLGPPPRKSSYIFKLIVIRNFFINLYRHIHYRPDGEGYISALKDFSKLSKNSS